MSFRIEGDRSSPVPHSNRTDRKRARTRAALISAAAELLASPGGLDASVQQITDRADVGVGSFYNHFTSKAELFDAAIAETLDRYGELFDQASAGIEDPAEVFANGIRMTMHLTKTHAQLTGTLLTIGFRLMTSDGGLAPRALRDLRRAGETGRLRITDYSAALACTAGSLLGCLQLLATDPDTDIDTLADTLATNLLCMFGLSLDDARAVATKPLKMPSPAAVRRAR
ncbi:TetR/AcrR family transcriptional regulator [Nocardia farcinica]|nr:TetR/AcrR family transcriptional regulator [Nocardia farcinica]MBF6248332.1 TetR/AcrR family transcriptional regulator [Nocardia elegans]PEH75880.1 TetR family transcriptional regulator [Nocardia sp. FDAARGOS_372]MBF6258002.1 TetR/AcrR family transcriptional regulator [Nocardia farcinica]MBF6292963.1 TetR/AcrR family transcriptional regulator [Nocardia farcinica]